MKNSFGDDVVDNSQGAVNSFGDSIVPHTDIAKDPSLLEALFPRMRAASESGQSYPKQVGAGVLDAVSGLIRYPAAGAAALANKVGLTYNPDTPKLDDWKDFIGLRTVGKVPEGTTFTKALSNLNQGKNEAGDPSLIAKIGADPATVPTTLASSLIPIPGKNPMLRLGAMAGNGLIQALASEGTHQTDNATQGKGFSTSDLLKEGAKGTALGGLLGAASEGASTLGSKIVKAALKGGHIGKSEGLDVANVFKNNVGGSMEQMTQKTSDALTELRGLQDQAIAKNANIPIPVAQISNDVQSQIAQQMKQAKHFGDSKIIESQFKNYEDDLRPLLDPATGTMPLSVAYEMKKKVANDAVALYKAANAGKDTKAMAAQAVSALFAQKLTDAIEAAAPEVTAQNPKFKELIPIAKALARRNVISGQNNPVGLDELAAIDAGTNFLVNGHPSGAVLPFVARALKSPYVGNKLYQTGQKIQSPIATSLLEAVTNSKSGQSQQ